MARKGVTTTRQKPRRTRGKPTEVDLYVGRRIRHRRQLLGLSQTKLADALNVTFQQVQKYERGSNRVGAGRLFQLSRVLDVPVGYFFSNLDSEGEPESTTELELTREHARFVRALSAIDDEALRRRIYALVEEISKSRQGAATH